MASLAPELSLKLAKAVLGVALQLGVSFCQPLLPVPCGVIPGALGILTNILPTLCSSWPQAEPPATVSETWPDYAHCSL